MLQHNIHPLFRRELQFLETSATKSTLRPLFFHNLLTKCLGRYSVRPYTLPQQRMKISKPVFRLSSVFTRQLLSQAAAVIDVPLCSVRNRPMVRV